MFFHLIFAATLVAVAAHLQRIAPSQRNRDCLVEIGLLYLLGGFWGIGGVLGSLPHILAPDWIADFVGWPAGNPFQVEVGFANLGMSLAGVLCFWLRGWFWLSGIVSKSVFLLGAAYVHIGDILATDNLNPGNAGAVLFYDIAIPLLAGALFAIYARRLSLPTPPLPT